MSSFLIEFVKKERKKLMTPMTSFLMLFTKVSNLIFELGSKHPIKGDD
jgi:hypothetical protein